MADKPLTGVKVIELTTFVAGPAAGGIMADWGADVIRVEPPGGDVFRDAIGSLVGLDFGDCYSKSPSFYVDNRGKRSVCLDLKKPECKEAFFRLLGQADIFVSNQRAPVLDRLGLNPQELHARFPRLIICPITAYGLQGPCRQTSRGRCRSHSFASRRARPRPVLCDCCQRPSTVRTATRALCVAGGWLAGPLAS